MAIHNGDSKDTGQGPAIKAPQTEDGLYPDAEGDLGHKRGGDTEPLPGSNEPLTSGADTAKPKPGQGTVEPDWERNDKVDDPDLPANSPLADGEQKPSGRA